MVLLNFGKAARHQVGCICHQQQVLIAYSCWDFLEPSFNKAIQSTTRSAIFKAFLLFTLCQQARHQDEAACKQSRKQRFRIDKHPQGTSIAYFAPGGTWK